MAGALTAGLGPIARVGAGACGVEAPTRHFGSPQTRCRCLQRQ
jgi:hypothetical protein